MDYNEREARRRQEDRDLNRALIWVGAAIVLEFLLVLVNRYYINYRTTSESINLALAINAGLTVLQWVSLAAVVACVVWAVLRLNKGEKAGLQLTLIAGAGILLICSVVILHFQDAGVRMLFWLVPAWAALALVYYLYQREFFLAALVSGAGVLGLWFVRHAGAASLYTIVAIAAIVLLAAAMFWMKSHQGRLIVKEGIKRVLPSDAGYGLMFASCVVSLAAIAAAVVLGGVSTTGGEGKIVRVVVGLLIMGVLMTGMTMMNIPDYYQRVVKGVVLIAAITYDILSTKRAKNKV